MPTSKAKTSPVKLPKKSKKYSLEDFLKISKKGQVWQVDESRFRIQRKGTFQKQPKGGKIIKGTDYDLDFFQTAGAMPNLLETAKITKKKFLEQNKNFKFEFVRSEQITVTFPGKRSPSAYNIFVEKETKGYNKFSSEKTVYTDGGLSRKQQNIRAWREELKKRWEKMSDFEKGKYEAEAAKKKKSQCNDGFVLTKVNVPKGIRKEGRWMSRLINKKEVVYVLNDQGKPVKNSEGKPITKNDLTREGQGSWGKNGKKKKRRVVSRSRRKAGVKNYARRKDIHEIWTGTGNVKAKRKTILTKYKKYFEKKAGGSSDKQIEAVIQKISDGFERFRNKNQKHGSDKMNFKSTKTKRFCNPKMYKPLTRDDTCRSPAALAAGKSGNLYPAEPLETLTLSDMAQKTAKKPGELHGNIFAMVHPDKKNKYFVVVGSTEMSDKYGVDERTKTYLNVMDYNPETAFMGKEVYLFPIEPSEVGSKKTVLLQGGKKKTGLRFFPTKSGSKFVRLTAVDEPARLEKLQVREDRKVCVKCPKHTTAETSNRYPNGYCEPDAGYKWIGNPFPGRGELVKIEGKKKMNKKKKMSKREEKKEKEKEKEDDVASQNSDLSSAAEESEEVKVKPKFITGTQLLEEGKIGDRYEDNDEDGPDTFEIIAILGYKQPDDIRITKRLRLPKGIPRKGFVVRYTVEDGTTDDVDTYIVSDTVFNKNIQKYSDRPGRDNKNIQRYLPKDKFKKKKSKLSK